MSYCVTINSLEHLPAEETLLIHYNISCSGIWHLNQLDTAYRNVCDSGWTVMYPNHQHPLHSDFPISTTSSTNATFAWNYGGIQGISAVNFDENHSYLVQLSIYDYYCLNTGEPPVGDPVTGGGGVFTGDSSTGLSSGGGGGGKKPPPPPPPPGGGGNIPFFFKPAPPPPPAPGGGGGGGPSAPIPSIPSGPTGPTTGGKGPITGTGGGPSTGGPIPPAKPRPGAPTTGGPSGPSTGGPVPPARPPGGGGVTGPTTGGRPKIPLIPTGGGTIIPTGGGLIQPVKPVVTPTGGGVGTGGGGLIQPVPTTGPGGLGQGGGLGGGYVPPSRLPIVPPIQQDPPSDPGDPGGQPNLNLRPFQYIQPVPYGNEPGTQQPNNNPGTNVNQQVNSEPVAVNRLFPAAPTPGGEPQFVPQPNPGISLSTSLSSKTFYPEGADPGTQEAPFGVNYRQVGELGEGAIRGSLENTLINSNPSSFNSKSNQINKSNFDQNSTLNVIVGNRDINVGEPIVVSAVFKSPQQIKAKLVIEAQDKSRLVSFVETPLLEATDSSPLTCGTSINSSVFNSSPITVICKAISDEGKVINVRSYEVTVTNPKLEGTTFSSKVTQSNNVPDKIIRDGKLATTPVDIELKHNSSTFVIVESTTAKEEFSTVLQSSNTTKDSYSLSVYDGSNGIDSIISGNFISGQSELYSRDRYVIDEQEYKPETHTAALPLSNITSSNCLLVEISPDIGNSPEDTEGKLFINSEFTLRQESFVGDAALQSVSGSVPYLNEKYGLIINGKAESTVPSDYTENFAVSDNLGQLSWTSLSLTSGDYYSIVKAKKGIINPFVTPVYVGRVQ